MKYHGKIKSKKLKAQWLKDLRSGNYKQGKKVLCSKGTKNVKAEYCCLGVLGCSIQKIKAFPIEFIEYDIFDNKYMSYDSQKSYADLPSNLRHKIGISPYSETQLIVMNDDGNKSFKEIADWIEENL